MAEMENVMNFNHSPVLLNECIEALNINPNGIYVDGTAGGGGHSFEIASRLKNGKLICIDRDINAIETLKKKLSPFSENIIIVHDKFSNLKYVLENLGISKIDGIILDLGVSSHQLDEVERGFSYMGSALLDMRMDTRQGVSAYDVVNKYDEKSLREIFYKYGEEKYSSRIAKNICKYREDAPIKDTLQLVEIIKRAMPAIAKKEKQHPAKRVFQAIRIEVNEELQELTDVLKNITELINAGGRVAIITFHSLEDRIVKIAFTDLSISCKCPKEFPICVCNGKAKVKLITKKPIISTEEELNENPRARSAKLRVAEIL